MSIAVLSSIFRMRKRSACTGRGDQALRPCVWRDPKHRCRWRCLTSSVSVALLPAELVPLADHQHGSCDGAFGRLLQGAALISPTETRCQLRWFYRPPL